MKKITGRIAVLLIMSMLLAEVHPIPAAADETGVDSPVLFSQESISGETAAEISEDAPADLSGEILEAPEEDMAYDTTSDEWDEWDDVISPEDNPEYISPEEMQRYIDDGTWEEKSEMMDSLADEQDEMFSSLVGNLAMYGPDDELTADGAMIGEKQPVTGITGATIPSTGYVNAMLFTAEFSDMTFSSNYKKSLKSRFFGNQDNRRNSFPLESIKAYYERASYGKLHINGDVHNYVSRRIRKSYDSKNKRTRNHDLYAEIFENWMDSVTEKTPSGQDEDEYLAQSLKRYDANNDKIIDAIYILYAGPVGQWGTQWWNYRTSFSYTFGNTGYKCKHIVFMHGDENVNKCVRTAIHETGHLLGLVDYYPYTKEVVDGKRVKVSRIHTFDMMDNNFGDHNGFSKMLLGWIPKEKVKIVTSGTQLSAVKPYATDGDIVLIMPRSQWSRYGIYSEFIMAEYYQPVCNDYLDKKNKPRAGLRLYHIYARLNRSATDFVASNRYIDKIPLIAGIDKDHRKHKGHESYWSFENCMYNEGNEFAPWTSPGSAFYTDSNGDGNYLRSSLKYSGIFINRISFDNKGANFKVSFISPQFTREKFKNKSVIKRTGHSMSKKQAAGYRRYTLQLNQDVRVVPGKKVYLYNGKRSMCYFDSKSFKTTMPGHQSGYTRSNVYLNIPDKYISGKKLRIVIPAGTFVSTSNWASPEMASAFDYSPGSVLSQKQQGRKTAGLSAAVDPADAEDGMYSWKSECDLSGNGIMAVMEYTQNGTQELTVYGLEDGDVADPDGSKIGSDILNGDNTSYYTGNAEITQVVRLSENIYLIAVGGLYKPYDGDEEEEDYDNEYYDLITVNGDGEKINELVIKAGEDFCEGFLDGRFAIVTSANEIDKQTLTLYDPVTEGTETISINAGISNEGNDGDTLNFLGGDGVCLKRVGNYVAFAPDGESWCLLVENSGIYSSVSAGFDGVQYPDAIEFSNDKYYALTYRDRASLSANDTDEDVDDDDWDDYDPEKDDDDEIIYDDDDIDDDDDETGPDGGSLGIYNSIGPSSRSAVSANLAVGADQIKVSDEGIIVYGEDSDGIIFSDDLKASEYIDDISIHEAFPLSDGGFLVTCDNNVFNYYDDYEEDIETAEYDVSEEALMFYCIYPPRSNETAAEPPHITTLSPNPGTVGLDYYTLLDADGDMPVRWTVSSGNLPNGLSLNSASGEITGVPEESGETTVTLCAENSAGTDSRELTFNIETEPGYITIAGIPKYVQYTGRKQVFPDCVVYYRGRKLTPGRDYSLKYINAVSTGTGKVQVVLKNGLEGRVEQEFMIYPADIGDPEFSADDICVKYKNNSSFKPAPVLKWKGKKLKAGRDYSIEGGEARRAPGSYTVKLTGMNDFEGTREITFTVTDKIPMKNVSVKKIPAKAYTGYDIRPVSDLKVTYRGKTLDKSAYTVEYENNVEPGRAYIILKGTGRASNGTAFEGSKKIPFEIKGVSLKKALKRLKIPSVEYSQGEACPVSDSLLKAYAINLTEGDDFELEYVRNDRAGKAAAIFRGNGIYTGTVKKTFVIKKYKLRDGDPGADVLIDDAEYAKGGARSEPVVVVNGTTLAYGTDYTLAYSGNKKAGKSACVIIKGKGNYSGKLKAYFNVDRKSLNNTTCFAQDVKFGAGKKAGAYLVKPVLTDTDGKKLKAGTDYLKRFTYVYDKAVTLADGTARNEGDAVKADDILPAGTAIRVNVEASGPNYMGSTSAVYRVVSKLIKNISFTVTGDYYYNGLRQEPGIADIKGTGLSSNVIEIIGYGKNIKPGKGTVTLHGLGEYGGTAAVKFRIKARSINKGAADYR